MNNFQDAYFYHGSPFRIERFCVSFCGKGNDQIGSGIYCTTQKSIAAGYCEYNTDKFSKFSGLKISPTVHKLRLSIKNPLEVSTIEPLSQEIVKAIIMASPCLDDSLSNFGDVEWEGFDKVINLAAANYANVNDSPLLNNLHMLANDFYPDEVAAFNTVIRDQLGYDSVVEYFEEQAVVCVWFAEDIEIISRQSVLVPQDSMEP